MATETKLPISEGASQWIVGVVGDVDECSDETTACITTSNGDAFTNGAAILDSGSSADIHTQEINFADTTYANVSQVVVHAYCDPNWGGGTTAKIDIDTSLFSDKKALAAAQAAPGWFSATWSGSWTQAQINAMTVEFIADYQGDFDQPSIAATYIVYTEEAVSSSSSSSSISSSSSSSRSSTVSSSSSSSSESSSSSSLSSSSSSSSESSSSSSISSSSSSSSSSLSSSSSSISSSSSSSSSSVSSSSSSSSSASSSLSSSSSSLSSSSSSSSSSISSSSSSSSSSSVSSSSSSSSSSASSSSSSVSSSSSSSASSSSSSLSSSSSSWVQPTTQDYSRGDYAALPADNDTDLENLFVENEYIDVATDNNQYASQTATNEFAIFLFKDKHSVSTDHINVTWTGKTDRAPSVSTVYLQIFNRTLTSWETLTNNAAAAADTEFTLTGIQEASLGDYYDGSSWVSCRVYQEAA